MGNVQIECTKADLYWMHCQLCGIDGSRTEDLAEAERQRVEHRRMHADDRAETEAERCPECHMPLTMHHNPGCTQPCGPCEARSAAPVKPGVVFWPCDEAGVLDRAAAIIRRRMPGTLRASGVCAVLAGQSAALREEAREQAPGLPFDAGSLDFQRGVEFGLLFTRVKYYDRTEAVTHADMAELVMRLAESRGLPFSASPHEHGESCAECVGRSDCKDGGDWLDVTIG